MNHLWLRITFKHPHLTLVYFSCIKSRYTVLLSLNLYRKYTEKVMQAGLATSPLNPILSKALGKDFILPHF